MYAPNKDYERKEFFQRLEEYVKSDRLIVLLGDFNCVCKAEDRITKRLVRNNSAELLKSLMQENGLDDVAEVLSVMPHFTHFQGESHARLDRTYVSLELVSLRNSYEVKHVSFIDHSLVMFTCGKKRKGVTFLVGALEV